MSNRISPPVVQPVKRISRLSYIDKNIVESLRKSKVVTVYKVHK